MKHLSLLFTIAVFCLSSGRAQDAYRSNAVAVPHLVRFAGVVKDVTGEPLAGTMGVTFTLYREQEGGAPLWLETQNVTADSGGSYTVSLGATRADGLPVEMFTSGEARWLGVQPAGQAEQPRVLLLSVPYALKAGDAETVGGGFRPRPSCWRVTHKGAEPAPRRRQLLLRERSRRLRLRRRTQMSRAKAGSTSFRCGIRTETSSIR